MCYTVYIQVGLGGKQVLYTLPSTPLYPSVITLRHDVDALLFSPSLSLNTAPIVFTHTSTFNALGYVQASKRDKKYLYSSYDGSCAVLADTSRHVFVYINGRGLYSPQYIHTLPHTADSVIGVQITNNNVFILTENSLTVLYIK